MNMPANSSPASAQLYGSQVAVGTDVTPLKKVPTAVQLFRYSAVTWNAHRIHFEKEYAQEEGHPDILVQAHLHGAFLLQMLMEWSGPKGRISSFGWSNRGRAVPGDELTCRGRVIAISHEGDRTMAEIELSEVNQAGAVCATGHARVSLPSRPGGDS